ncbi:hypothetical protein K493DRAFT_313464 [Basidiobolus meristosporus CBS 931.73]|uniref:Uncharacterized protein n=1 Tax=Basidiobolus meristosporus CBS 931.73 TaxID=1314790 RepID=A0A1Y1YLF4_9FUNG|nr:hypothetical protein K493DRAFT_313464 [Basidiobolus meristosporus CBS 931.73]|eukprot:ORX98839.1 hypothetical protein K493DRAFT_313464 [Basidiobolus meristosporus CBS 931.73]
MLSKVCAQSPLPQPSRFCPARPIPSKPTRPSPLISVPDDYQESQILAPSPKKMIYRGGSFSSDNDEYLPWSLPLLDEDSDEDSFDGDSLSDQHESDDSGEAFAELFNIIHKSSAPSSPLFGDYSKLSEHSSTLNHLSTEQGITEYLGRSPIFRTQNPLPLDTMFSKSGAETAHDRLYRPAAVAPFDVNLLRTPPLTEKSPSLHLTFEKLPPRPRSYSAGARPDQSGITF